MFKIQVANKAKTHNACSETFFKNCTVNDTMWKQFVEPGEATDGDTAHALLNAGYLRLQTQTQNMQYLLLVHCNNGSKNAPLCYACLRTLPVLLKLYKVPCRKIKSLYTQTHTHTHAHTNSRNLI
jgi:hypothetical protein